MTSVVCGTLLINLQYAKNLLIELKKWLFTSQALFLSREISWAYAFLKSKSHIANCMFLFSLPTTVCMLQAIELCVNSPLGRLVLVSFTELCISTFPGCSGSLYSESILWDIPIRRRITTAMQPCWDVTEIAISLAAPMFPVRPHR